MSWTPRLYLNALRAKRAPRVDASQLTRRDFVKQVGVAVTLAAVSASSVGPRRLAEGATWIPPIGIPAPSFGINEQPPAPPASWNGPVAGFYYVDNTAANASDSTNGSPGQPRLTVPATIPAGAYVEVHGGTAANPYILNPGGTNPSWTSQGTQASPCFIKGVGGPIFQGASTNARDFVVAGRYLIIDGIALRNWEIHFAPTGDHVSLRNSEVYNTAITSGQFSSACSPEGSDIVIYNCHIHDVGDFRVSATQNDFHGVKCSTRAFNIWVVDCEIDHCGGNGTQMGDDAAPEPWCHHIYIGRNHIHHTRKSPMDTKESRDVIMSQNNCHDAHFTSDHETCGVAIKRCGVRIWAIFNLFHDLDQGGHYTDSNDTSLGRFTQYFTIGNIFYNIGLTTSGQPDDTAGNGYAESSGFKMINVGEGQSSGNSMIAVVGNTFSNCRFGIGYGAGGGPTLLTIANNIINITGATHHFTDNLTVAHPSHARNNLLDPTNAGQARIVQWREDGVVRNIASFQSAYPNDGSGNVQGTPAFVNAPSANFHLQSTSAARAIGLNDPDGVYALFASSYGLSIRVDFDGRALPASGAWDAGALQFAGVAGPQPTAPGGLILR